MQSTKRELPDPSQTELFGVFWRPFRYPFRLRPGDVFEQDGRFCRVVRVNECAAVVTMTSRRREFTTRFDKHVRLQPSPILFRISPNAGVQILNRKTQ